jgi:guanylate kinase
MHTEKNNALLLVISAPSGAGKSTLCNRLVEKFPGMTYSVSCTTRAPRGEEKNGEHYHFLSPEEFRARVDRDEFLEYANVHGNFYGTLKSTVREALKARHDLIMDIDVQGATQIRTTCESLPKDDPIRRGFVDIFIEPPSMDELRRRLCGRATDGNDIIEKRMCNAEEEMQHRDAYQHRIVNDQLDTAFENLANIVHAEQEKRL